MTTICLIDDDVEFAGAVRSVLEGAGYQVTAATDRESGQALIDRASPDLLVLDIMMRQPDDGIVLARALRRQGHAFPIVMLSSVAEATGTPCGIDAEMLPADAFLEKPVMPSHLLRTIQRLIAARQAIS